MKWLTIVALSPLSNKNYQCRQEDTRCLHMHERQKVMYKHMNFESQIAKGMSEAHVTMPKGPTLSHIFLCRA